MRSVQKDLLSISIQHYSRSSTTFRYNLLPIMAQPAQSTNNGHPLIAAPSRWSKSDARTFYHERSEAGRGAWIRTQLDLRFAEAGVLSAEFHHELVRRHDEFITDTLAAMHNAIFQRKIRQEQKQSLANMLSPEERARISQLPTDQRGKAILGMISQAREKQEEKMMVGRCQMSSVHKI
ncbi:hypothetical protein AC579_5304 [Pseudocercospora musae]|uniref:Uncharacterized protein n=1 Tax=Pseudocercospora musae TaxID=113226 RepID=A0A139I333_9PEZI|nr:hypothetical protein AC579_5304 [Pseudocercospora musae]